MNRNRTEEEQQDILQAMFARMSDEPLPPDFLPAMMQRIREEAVRIRKRDAWWRATALTAASLTIVGLAVAVFVYQDFPRISISPFHIYIGILSLVLLFVDSWFRQKYFEKHPESL
jgi:negative regulator of sigma E activity